MAPAFAAHTDEDFARLDAGLLDEVIALCVQYSRSRNFSAPMSDAQAGNAALDRARVILGFLTTPYHFRRYYDSVEQAAPSGLLTAANGFTPHNDANAEALASALRAKLPPAILAERIG